MPTVRLTGIVIIVVSLKWTPVLSGSSRSAGDGNQNNGTLAANDTNRFPGEKNDSRAIPSSGDSVAEREDLSHIQEELTFNFNASNLNGSDNVYQLIASETFIDKSLLIKDYLELRRKVAFISRPHGWGKTTNLQMLKLFLEIVTDESGNRVPPERSANRKLFLGGELAATATGRPLNPLKISRFRNITDSALGTNPVILANLKNFGTGYGEIEKAVRRSLAKLFGEHEYLAKRLESKQDRKLFEKYRNERTALTRYELERGLAVLTELVGKQFNRTVHLLVDDYDAAINYLFAAIIIRARNEPGSDRWNDTVLFDRAFESKDLSESFLLYRSLLFHCTELGNTTVKMLVTGIQPSLLLAAEPRDLIEYSVRETKLSDHFGFSEAEIGHLLKRVPFAVDGTALKEWYGGYHFGVGHAYNPSSVVRCLAAGGKFGVYWTDRDDLAGYHLSLANVVLSLDETQQNIQRLLDGKNVTFNLNRKILFHNLFNGGLFSILLFHGYLNYAAAMEIDTVSVPNREIESILKVKLLAWVYRKSEQVRKDWFEALRKLASLKVGFEDELRQLSGRVSDEAAMQNDTQHSDYYEAMRKCLEYASKYDSVVLNALRNVTNLAAANNYPQ